MCPATSNLRHVLRKAHPTYHGTATAERIAAGGRRRCAGELAFVTKYGLAMRSRSRSHATRNRSQPRDGSTGNVYGPRLTTNRKTDDQRSVAWSRNRMTSESMRWRPTASFDPPGDHRNAPTVTPENLRSSRRGEPSSGWI